MTAQTIRSRRLVIGATLLLASLLLSARVSAQNLGPFRQFLALEGSYQRLELDAGDGNDRLGLNGYGARLWINLAPFSGPRPNLIDKTAIALAYSTTSRSKGISTRQYGAELNMYPLHVPIGNIIDPFLILGAGAFRIDNQDQRGLFIVPGPDVQGEFRTDIRRGARSYFAFSPGVGIRIPIPNRLQLRLEARDLILFNRRDGSGDSRTSQSPQFMAGAGLTF